MNFPSTCMLAACAAALWAVTSPAAETSVLTLRDALSLTAARNPDLAGFSSQTTALHEQAALRALRPRSSIDLELENFAGTGALSGARVLESTLQLSQVLELGGKAQARRRVGDLMIESLDADQRSRQTDLFAQVALRFVRVLADQEHLQARQRATVLAEHARSAARSRVEAGAASPTQASRADIALARARIEQEHAEHELSSSRVALAVLWNEPVPRFTQASGALFTLPAPEPLDDYLRRLDANPQLLSVAARRAVLDAELELAETQRRADLTLNVGVRRLEAFDDSAFVAGVSMPLGVARRASGEIRMAQAQRAAIDFDEQSQRLELHATLYRLYQELTHARTEAEALRGDIQPQAQSMLQVTQDGYRAGRFSFLELADAQQQLLEIEQDAIRAAADFHTQLIEIERITGQPVGTLMQGESR